MLDKKDQKTTLAMEIVDMKLKTQTPETKREIQRLQQILDSIE